MALTPDSSPDALQAFLFGQDARASTLPDTAALISAMLHSGVGISDLIFSPGRPPQVERHGELTPVTNPELPKLQAADTSCVALDVIAGNGQALRTLDLPGDFRTS